MKSNLTYIIKYGINAPYFSCEPTYNYVIFATIYDKRKIGCPSDILFFGAVDRNLPFGQSVEIRDNYEKETALRWPYFSREPAYKYLVCKLYTTQKNSGIPRGIPLFLVRSTGIEPRSKIRNPFIFKAFRLSVPEKSPK